MTDYRTSGADRWHRSIQYKAWARIVVIVLSALDLLNIPLRTALGIYGFWVLLNKDTEQLFLRPPLPAVHAS